MLSRAIRTAAVSLALLGGTVAFAPLALAQDVTTTIAPTADTTPVDTVAPVADTVAPVADEAPTGGVAAGGGFLSDDNGSNTLPIALGAAAVALAAGGFAVKRRKA